jgi:hypothetical protein
MRHAGLPPLAPLPGAGSPPSAPDGAAPLLDADPGDGPVRSDAVVAALEQLYAAYKARRATRCAPRARPLLCAPASSPIRRPARRVSAHPGMLLRQVEHWACLEELRDLHAEFQAAGGSARAAEGAAGPDDGAGSPGAPAPAAAAATFRELLHALGLVQPRRPLQQPPDGKRQPGDAQQPAGADAAQQQQQQPASGGGADAMDVDAAQQPGAQGSPTAQRSTAGREGLCTRLPSLTARPARTGP